MESIQESALVFSENADYVVENGKIKQKKKPKKVVKKKPSRMKNGSTDDFCLKCKQVTENTNKSYRVTSNNRNIRSSLCATCGATKTSFITAGEVEHL